MARGLFKPILAWEVKPVLWLRERRSENRIQRVHRLAEGVHGQSLASLVEGPGKRR